MKYMSSSLFLSTDPFTYRDEFYKTSNQGYIYPFLFVLETLSHGIVFPWGVFF